LTVILGTGLSVTYNLKGKNKDFIINENGENTGRTCRNININGYTLILEGA